MGKIIKTCLVCNKSFETTDYLLSINKGKFCTRKCHDLSQIGVKQSENTKSKRSQKMIGKRWKVGDPSKMGKFRIGKSPWNKGKKLPSGIDHPNFGKHWKIADTSKYGKHVCGEKNNRWKGGTSKVDGYQSWSKNKRNRVLKRIQIESGTHTFSDWEILKKQYNFTCPCCKKSEPVIKLTEDHIIPLSKGGSDNIENIQPLCMPCNAKKHILIIKY